MVLETIASLGGSARPTALLRALSGLGLSDGQAIEEIQRTFDRNELQLADNAELEPTPAKP